MFDGAVIRDGEGVRWYKTKRGEKTWYNGIR